MTEVQSIIGALKKCSFLVLRDQKTFSEKVMFSRMRSYWLGEKGERGTPGSRDTVCKGESKAPERSGSGMTWCRRPGWGV